ncbi:MAG: hypothetical protein AAF928_14330 [Myxococcota bacterium]
MGPENLSWDDDHPTFQQLRRPTGWDAGSDEEQRITTVPSSKTDVLAELAVTKRRLRIVSVLAAVAAMSSVVLAILQWRPTTAAAPAPAAAVGQAEGDSGVAPAAPATPPRVPPSGSADPEDQVEAATSEPDAVDPPVAEGAEKDASKEAEPGFGIRAAGEGIRMYLDGVDRRALPLTLTDMLPGVHDVRFEDAVGRKRVIQVELGADELLDLGTVRFDAARVQVVVALATPGTTVLLQADGTKPRYLGGPWPMSLELHPGRYTLIGARGGKQTYVRLLDLDLDRPYREFTVRSR